MSPARDRSGAEPSGDGSDDDSGRAVGDGGGLPAGAKRPCPLEALIAPLSFAAKNGMKGVERLRGLEQLVSARVAAARAGNTAPVPVMDELERLAAGFEAAPLERRVEALRAMTAVLSSHLALPPDLAAISEAGPRGSGAGPGSSARRRTDGKSAGDDRSADPSSRGVAPSDPGRLDANATTSGPFPRGRDVDASPGRASAGEERGGAETASGAAGSRAVLPERPPTGDPVLDGPLDRLLGVGASRAKAFAERGVRSVQDAIWFLPVSYERRSFCERMDKLRDGVRATVEGRVVRAGDRLLGRRRRVFEALLSDETGSLRVRYYRSVPWLSRRLQEGNACWVSGMVRRGRDGALEMAHPDILDQPGGADSSGREDVESIVPRYPDVEGVPPRTVREIIARALEHAHELPEVLPSALIRARSLASISDALSFLHRPPPDTPLDALENNATAAHRRLVYEELFFLQLGLALKAKGVQVEPGVAIRISEQALTEAMKLLPFSLTGAQERAVREIAADMSDAVPMHRLLQGDVGSGKTAVAAVALAVAVRAGFQGAVMAPTELLAEQHHRTLSALLEPGGIQVVLFSGRLRAAERREALEALSHGRAKVAVGTHALIQQGVEFQRLGVVVVDEQHRFGVKQRALLMEKGRRPDTLVMTATPIPRTLAMTAYGDLDLSIIDELPPGRTPVITQVFDARRREVVWEQVRARVEEGRQAFVVYPIVEASEHLEEVKAASEMAAELARDVFPELGVGLMHGRMSPPEKDDVMGAFSAGRIHVLVATTVVEVGIDVPNATVMVIEHAERFGLSQLHQLRGRVGRGANQSFCYLVAHEVRGQKVRDRLAIMAKTNDGFLVAEEDLRIRGPGEVLGTRQSGHPDLLFGNLARDRSILARAREDAFALVEADPDLALPEHRPAAQEVLARWGGRIQVGRVG